MGFSRQEYWSGQPFPSPGDLPSPGIEPRSPALQADSSPAKPQEKSKNTAVGSLSLLQGIFRTQDWNRGLLHCRQILYQLSYQGSPLCIYYKFSNQSNAWGLRGAGPRGIRLSHCLPVTLSSCDFSPEVLLTQLTQPSTFRGDKSMSSQHIMLHDGGQCGPTRSYHGYHVSISESLV